MFIARISRGRTIRELVTGVLFNSTAFTFLWMTVFGITAIWLDLGPAAGGIADAAQANLSTALFKFLEYLPEVGVTSTPAIVLVAVFFVTSADFGALGIDTIASGGAEDTPRWQRIYWCVPLGVTATLLLVLGMIHNSAATSVCIRPIVTQRYRVVLEPVREPTLRHTRHLHLAAPLSRSSVSVKPRDDHPDADACGKPEIWLRMDALSK